MMKPRAFIGSSRESLGIAYAVRKRLDEQADLTVWSQGIFQLSKNATKTLIGALDRFDFAIFVFAKEDLLLLRKAESREIRDNIILELALFAGSIGKDQIFVLLPKELNDSPFPAELLGITCLKFDVNGHGGNVIAAVDGTCGKLEKMMRSRGAFHTEVKRLTDGNVRPSLLTPNSPLLNHLINSAIETVCRAVALPKSPEASKIRVFIFRKESDRLVCTHYWAPNPVREMVGKLKFDITPETAKRVAVVRAILSQGITRTKVKPLPRKFENVSGEISGDLSFVLAAPIYNKDGTIWGTVDFDASTQAAKSFLSDEASNDVIVQLAQHLQIIFSLPT